MDNRADETLGAFAPPNFGRNKNKVFPLKRPSHKPTFHSSDNRTNEIWAAGKALFQPYIDRKRSKTSSLKRPKTKGPPSTLAGEDISKEESEDRINSILVSATMILNIILLSFFTKMILLLPKDPKIINPVIFRPSGTY